MRILGKGLTASAIKQKYPDAIWYDDNDFEYFDIRSDELTVVSPGIPPYNKLVTSTNNLISEYDLLIPQDKYTIWISGTNGKTTTTKMCQHLLSSYGSVCGGNVGTPLALLDENAPIWILETSSFTLHYTNIVRPNMYILLPIREDHTAWHGDFKSYEQSKLKPLSNMMPNDIAIIPKAYQNVKTEAFCIYYDKSEDLVQYFSIDSDKIDLKEPFLLDGLLAMAAEKILFDSINYDKINNFVQDPHKIEPFFDKKERLWIDDSKATNIDATIQAIDSYKDKMIHLILGGDDKGANMEPLFTYLKRFTIKLYLIGSNMEKLSLLASKYSIPYDKCGTLQKSIKSIDRVMEKDTIAILSPAAASLDQFSSYKERGEIMKKIVKEL